MNVLGLFTTVYGHRGSAKGWRPLRRLRQPWRVLWHWSIRGAINLAKRTWRRYRVWSVPDAWITPPPLVGDEVVLAQQNLYGIMQRISIDRPNEYGVRWMYMASWAEDKALARWINLRANKSGYVFVGDELSDAMADLVETSEGLPTIADQSVYVAPWPGLAGAS